MLGEAMARWLPRNPESYVLELGPGTGAVTDALLKYGLRENRLLAIEKIRRWPLSSANVFSKPILLRAMPGTWTNCWPGCRSPLNRSARSSPACRC